MTEKDLNRMSEISEGAFDDVLPHNKSYSGLRAPRSIDSLGRTSFMDAGVVQKTQEGIGRTRIRR